MASIKDIKIDDAQEHDSNDITVIVQWKDKCDDIMTRLQEAKEERGRWNQECGKLQREFNALYNKGWIAMAQETPLFDGIEDETQNDPDAWRSTPIHDTNMKESLKKKLTEHWNNLGEVADWIDLAFPPKMKGIGQKVKDEITEWFDDFHAPAMESELERIKSENTQESELEFIPEDDGDDEYSLDEDEPEYNEIYEEEEIEEEDGI